LHSTPPQIVLIDDDPAVLSMVGDVLKASGMQVHSFSSGTRAMKALEDSGSPDFDLVISDINMEGMDGFDVIHRVKAIRSNLPVMLMTGATDLEYAIRAMRMGAANLFQKPLAMRDLVSSVFHMVELHRELRMAESSLKGLVHESRLFSFSSNELDIPSTVLHLTDRLVSLGFANAANVDVIAMAFHEALVNALEHGNLELESDLKSDLFSEKDAYISLLEMRMSDPVFGSRRIEVEADLTSERFEVTIKDGGRGFDTSRAFTLGDSVTRRFGRGLAMIYMVMDEVSFNDVGNQIRMVLRKK
jgi:DNA-binding response OmpR family regulator